MTQDPFDWPPRHNFLNEYNLNSAMLGAIGESPRRYRDVRNLVARVTSLRKIEANRKNAMKSSGPRTERGKSLARLNALKFGAFSSLPLLFGEDGQEHKTLSQSVISELAPKTVVESMLVDQIIGDLWRLKRIERAEQAYFGKLRETLGSRVFQSMSDKELDQAIELLEGRELFRKALNAKTNREENAANSLSLDILLSGPSSDDAPLTPDQKKAKLQELIAKLESAEDLGAILLEGLASPQKDLPYAHIDRFRRAIVRDILQKHQSLAILQEQRGTIEPAKLADD